MKRFIAMFLVICMCFAALAGCGGNQQNQGASNAPAAASSADNSSADTSTPAAPNAEAEVKADSGSSSESASASDNPYKGGKYWLTDDPVTFTAFVSTRPMTDDYANNDFTRWFEDNTNIHLEFVVAPDGEQKEKYNLMLASGDYPDLNLNVWLLSRDEVNVYGKQGIIIPINDMIEQYGVNVKGILARYPDTKNYITLEDKKIYTMPTVSDALHMSDQWKMWVYQPWLSELGLSMPQTTEDYYDVLMTFKTMDPNGNGKADEIPAAGSRANWCAEPEVFLMNAFIYDDNGDKLWVENDKVDVTYNKPEWKEGLRYINRLVNDGLLLKESFTQDMNALIQIGENQDAQILGFTWGGYEGSFADLNGDRWTDYAICPALQGPAGVRHAPYSYNYATSIGTFITDKCKDPVLAFKMMDMMYDRDLTMIKENGLEGRDWRWAESGEMGYAGPGMWMALTEYGTLPKNTIWDQMGSRFEDEAYRIGMIIDVEVNPMEKILYEGTRDMLKPYYPDIKNLYPNVLLTDDETTELSVIGSELWTYVGEMTARFATGDVDIDAGWDDYLKELDNYNLARFLELKQAAYDRQK
jgi:putative aldouronate transport system substrate-binding protein